MARALADGAMGYGPGGLGRERSLGADLDRSSHRLEQWLAEHPPTVGNLDGGVEDLLWLAGALARLPDAQRRAVELREFRGLSVAEVSRIMGRSTAAVRGLLQRGLRTLRAMLEDPW